MLIGNVSIFPSACVPQTPPASEKSWKSKSGAVIVGSASSGFRSASQPPFAASRFCTCSASISASKEGAPEANSIAAFWRCCCSGTCSEPTVMPVSSVNSFSYFCSTSERGLLASRTSIFSPLNRFQSKSLSARAPAPGWRPAPRASAAPVLRKPRRCVGPNGKPELVVIAPTLIWSRTGGPAVVRVGRRCSGRIRRSIPGWRLPGLRRGRLAPASAASLPARTRLARRRQTHRLRQVDVVRRLVRDRHGGNEVLLEAGLDRGLDLLDPLDHALDLGPGAPVQERDAGARARRVPGRAHLVERAVGDHAQHHRVERVDVAPEGARQGHPTDALDAEAIHEEPRAGVERGLGELDRPHVALGDPDGLPAGVRAGGEGRPP